MKREITTTTTDYEANAQRIAKDLGLTVVAAFKGDRCPPWGGAVKWVHGCLRCGDVHGDRYRVTLKWLDAECTGSTSFDFWASKHDQETGKRPGYYDVLACVVSDAGIGDDLDEVVADYGLKPSQALAAIKHAAELQAFFTEAELEALAEIS